MANEMSSPLAPVVIPPERGASSYDVVQAPDAPGGRGPLRFEEGIATDTAVPDDFMIGMMQGYQTAPGRPNHNANVYIKTAEEVTRERAHLGSAAWPEAPTYTGAFAEGAGPEAERMYIAVVRDGAHYNRPAASQVRDLVRD